MNKLKIKLNRIKSYKKGKGFTNFTTKSTRLTRKQKTELEDKFKLILDKLTSSKKNKLSKTMAKIQGITRGNFTRKNFSKLKSKLLEKKEKHLKELMGPKFFKTLQELPIPLLDKMLNGIFENYNLQDDEVKNILIMSITTSTIGENFSKSLKNIVKIQELILTHCQKLVNILDKIIYFASPNIYPSSDDEEMREYHMEVAHYESEKYRMSMAKIWTELNKLLIIRERILKDLNNIFKIIYIKDKETNDNKFLKEFINIFSINWLKEFDNADTDNMSDTTNINLKIDESKKFLKSMISKVEDNFESLLKNKLIFTKNELIEIFDIIGPIYDSITNIDFNIDNYFQEITSKKKSQKSKK